LLNTVAAGLSGVTQPALPGFLNSLAGPIGHYGLWAILALVMIEDFGIPLPGETVPIAGAIYAGSGRLNVVAVGLVGFVAAVVGDNIGYAIGRSGGRALVNRWGKYVFLTPPRLDKAEAFFNKHGGKIVVVARFIEGLRDTAAARLPRSPFTCGRLTGAAARGHRFGSKDDLSKVCDAYGLCAVRCVD
jgi:membrane protein DedA with SNARE-associated domain